VSWILPDPEVLKSLKVLETRTIIKMAINDPRPKLGLDKDPEKRRAYLREWYGKNRERVKATQKAYELRNKEKIKARKLAWKKAQKEKKNDGDAKGHQANPNRAGKKAPERVGLVPKTLEAR
jgi:hypothetical protein